MKKQPGDRLTAPFVRSVKQPGRYGDGRGSYGLSFLVRTRTNGTVARYFQQKLRINGKVCMLGIGPADLVTLTEARDQAVDNARLARQGEDPRVQGTRAQTFQDAAEKVIRLHSPNWRGTGTELAWRSSMASYAYPVIGHKPADQVTAADVLAIVSPIWNDRRATARVVKQRIATIMAWAQGQGIRPDNPCDAVDASLPKNGVHVEHHRALAHQDVGQALATVRQSGATPVTKLAIEMIALTACRSGEVRGMRWNEIYIDSATWVIPAERTKTNREHRIPLSTRAVEILQARQRASTTVLAFASPRGGELTAAALSKLLKQLGIGGVVHGFRSSFRSWCAEQNIPREVAEAALAHTTGNATEQAYQRSDVLKQRRALMEKWANYIATENSSNEL